MKIKIIKMLIELIKQIRNDTIMNRDIIDRLHQIERIIEEKIN